MNTTMTYAEEQALRAQRKADREWKKTMAEAKVYVFTESYRSRQTETVIGEQVLKQIVRKATGFVEHGEKARDRFASEFLTNPTYALEWSHGLFDAIGQLQVGQIVLEIIAARPVGEYDAWSDLKVAREIVRRLTRDVIHAARSPARSTSAQSNEMASSLLKAKAEMLEDAQSMLNIFGL